MQNNHAKNPTRALGLHSNGRTGKTRVQIYLKKGTNDERRKTEYG
ncbi:MAG: hypothetical protein K0R10_1834 [Alphaproteobacteria bacterium]|jgi:hypothetical protein|nr:hypothetical protein [Alphaproteobacteria bacterium]